MTLRPGSKRLLWMVTAILGALLAGANALTQPEIDFLTAARNLYPSLARINSVDRFPENDMPNDYGRRWPADLSNACAGGSGYQIYGIYCSSAGYIYGILLYVSLV